MTLQENSLPRRIREYIAGHLSEDLTVNQLLRQFQISRSKLFRISSTFFGAGIEQTIRTERIHKAKDLLASTPLSIGKISATVGYRDEHYFCKVFKKHVGVTPIQYRKQRWEKLLYEDQSAKNPAAIARKSK